MSQEPMDWYPHDGRVVTALHIIDRGCSRHSSEALAWLLHRAATVPSYQACGVIGDLRVDLPMRIATAFDRDETRCCGDGGGSSVQKDWAVVIGCLLHYHGPGPYLDPVPMSLITVMRRIAQTPAGRLIGARDNGLIDIGTGTWDARRFLSERRMSWFATACQETRDECLDALRHAAVHLSWLAHAIHTEAASLPESVTAAVAVIWREIGDDLLADACAVLSIAGLGHLTAVERGRALALAADAGPTWHQYLLNSHISAATHLHLPAHRAAAVAALLDIAGDDAAALRDRVSGVYWATRHLVRGTDTDTGAESYKRLVALVRDPMFRDHPYLRHEIRRIDALESVS